VVFKPRLFYYLCLPEADWGELPLSPPPVRLIFPTRTRPQRLYVPSPPVFHCLTSHPPTLMSKLLNLVVTLPHRFDGVGKNFPPSTHPIRAVPLIYPLLGAVLHPTSLGVFKRGLCPLFTLNGRWVGKDIKGGGAAKLPYTFSSSSRGSSSATGPTTAKRS